MGSQPGLRISITSVIMLDNDSFSCDGSNCTRIDVQGRGGGDGSADVQQWPVALGPSMEKGGCVFSCVSRLCSLDLGPLTLLAIP